MMSATDIEMIYPFLSKLKLNENESKMQLFFTTLSEPREIIIKSHCNYVRGGYEWIVPPLPYDTRMC